ncbi:unnamed protein product [Protopolystoma xenopodis]|uniref:RIH domain-containing protein n=1 Tax=Protopolystoma xenopodis TaxID=117903 RepID=A0A448WIY0_9PLAT|nr:unnamed protein product [Protopolystoma xenopodis]
MVVQCCRFLCYFCRTSMQNQKAMFEHLSYMLENSSMLLSRPSLRGTCPLDVAYSSLMDNNELALALREKQLEKNIRKLSIGSLGTINRVLLCTIQLSSFPCNHPSDSALMYCMCKYLFSCQNRYTLQHFLVQIAVYLSRCGGQSNAELLNKGYPDIGWDPVEGERFLDFLRFTVWVNGEPINLFP